MMNEARRGSMTGAIPVLLGLAGTLGVVEACTRHEGAATDTAHAGSSATRDAPVRVEGAGLGGSTTGLTNNGNLGPGGASSGTGMNAGGSMMGTGVNAGGSTVGTNAGGTSSGAGMNGGGMNAGGTASPVRTPGVPTAPGR